MKNYRWRIPKSFKKKHQELDSIEKQDRFMNL